MWEEYPEIFTKEHFQGHSGSDQPPELPLGEFEYKAMKGFKGLRYSGEIDGKSIRVLEDTLNFAKNSNWSVMGLVRNETNSTVGYIVVEARLMNKEGKEIGKFRGQSLISSVRPGEPAPFIIKTHILSGEVNAVEWNVFSNNKNNNNSREFKIITEQEIPFGETTYQGIDRSDPPYNYKLLMSVENYGNAVNDIKVVVAWTNEKGHVVWIETVGNLKDGIIDSVEKENIVDMYPIEISDKHFGPLAENLINKIYWAVGQ